MIKIDPKIIGFNKNLKDAEPRIITIGFPPAGGWVTPRIIIKKIPKPTATAICKYWSTGKNCKIRTPANEVIKCPKKTFFGWAKGLSGYPKRSTIEEPKDPAKNIPYGVSKLKNDKVPMVIIENIKANRALLKFSFIILIIKNSYFYPYTDFSTLDVYLLILEILC